MEPIAFSGADRQLYILDALDREPRRLTDDPRATHTWPTWAPGRAALAAMRRPRGTPTEQPSVELWLDLPHAAGSPGPSAPISAPRPVWTASNGGPICLGWAPDGQHLALLVQEADDLHLLVAERSGFAARPVVSGAPLYWGWTGDSRALVVHVGGHHRYAAGARVLLVPVEGGPATETLCTRPLGFRAPACAPSGQRVAYATDEPGHRALVLHDLASGQRQPLANVGDEPAFVWSPDGRQLAVGGSRSEAGLYDELALVDADSGARRSLGAAVVAFFWTPDSAAVICAVPDPVGEGLAWERIDVADGRARRLASFTPTQELALLLGHFDQYAPAVRLYSGEEPLLLFSYAGDEARHNGQAAERSELWLARGDGPATLQLLAGGTIGFFAP
jgi:hypothetical protein